MSHDFNCGKAERKIGKPLKLLVNYKLQIS